MKKIAKKTLNFIKKDWLRLLVLLVVFSLLLIFSFDNFPRLIISFKSFFNSIVYYFKCLDNPKEVPLPATSLDLLIEAHGGSILNLIPINFERIFKTFPVFLKLLINFDYISMYFQDLGIKVSRFFFILTTIINLLFLYKIIRLLKQRFKPNDKPELTPALKKYLKLKEKISKFMDPAIKIIKFIFCRYVKITLILFFIFYLNLFSIGIDLIGNYYYLIANFDFTIILKGLTTLLIDFLPKFLALPVLIQIGLAYHVFDFIRIKLADSKMNKIISENKEFLESTGNVILTTGASRVGKNSLNTCLCLIYASQVLPEKILGIISEVESRYPFINYAKLALYMDEQISNKTINNQNDVYKLIFGKNKFNIAEFVDIKNADAPLWDNLTIEEFETALSDWMIAYMFNSIEAPLSVSNYTISFNQKINPKDHYFNIDHFDPLKETAEDYKNRIYNKVINFDYVRLGKKFKTYEKDNLFVPDIGVYSITEAGKERGSTDSIKNESSKASGCNRKSDKFHELLKIWSHIATVRHRTLFKVILDEQQDMEVNCELRKCADSIITLDKNRKKSMSALKLFFVEDFICKLIITKYEEANLKRKENRQCQSLPNYILKRIYHPIYMYYIRRRNQYDYDRHQLLARNGTIENIDDTVKNFYLYVPKKITYSGRFRSISLQKPFLDMMANAGMSFDSLRSYTTLTPSLSDYEYMQSYFYGSILKR